MIIKLMACFLLITYSFLIQFDELLGFGAGQTVTRYIGLCYIGVGFGAVAIRTFMSKQPKPCNLPFIWLPFFLLILLSSTWSIAPEETLTAFITLTGLYLIYLVSAFLRFSNYQIHAIKLALIGSGVIVAFYMIINRENFESTRSTLALENAAADPNHVATALIIPLILCLSYVITNKNYIFKTIAFCGTIVVFSAILLSGSRGSLLGALSALLFPIFLSSKRKTTWVMTLLLGTGVYSLVYLGYIPTELVERFQPDSMLSSGGSGRLSIWQVGWEAFLHKPYFGFGFNSFPYAYDTFFLSTYLTKFVGFHRSAHNIYLQVAVEIGVVGLLLFIAVLWFHYKALLRFADYSAAKTTAAILTGTLVSSMFIGTLHTKYFWMVFTLAIMEISVPSYRYTTSAENHSETNFIESGG